MEFLEVPLFDDDIFKLLVRFAINIFYLTLIVRFAIYPMQRERDFAFTAVMMNVTVFFICFSLKKLDLGIGMALGLFAIFGVLRYRTDAIRVKEMTYLFIVIGIAVVNSLSNKKTSYVEVALVNSIIFAAAMLKERIVGTNDAEKSSKKKKEKGKSKKAPAEKLSEYTLEYDKLELLGKAHRAALLADLRERTRLDVVKAQVKTIDLLKNRATLTVWCSDADVPAAEASSPADSEQL